MRILCSVAAAAALLSAPLCAQDWAQLYQFRGPETGDQLGYSIAPIDDLDGDGRGELLLGLYGSSGGGFSRGSALILSGRSGSTIIHQVNGNEDGELLGYAVTAIDDLNGDGKPEFAVSAPFAGTGAQAFAGRVYIYDGATGVQQPGVIEGLAGELLGWSLTSAELDGAAPRELVIGAPNAGASQEGVVYFYQFAGTSPVYLGEVPGSSPGEFFGFAMANVGDMRDGAEEEVAVGAPYALGGAVESGAIDLVSLSGSLDSYWISEAGAQLGMSLAGGGDLNGDGAPDLLAGSPEAGGGAGKVVLFDGTDSSLPPLREIDGNAGDKLGQGVAVLSDSDLNKRSEFAVGAYQANGTGEVQLRELGKASPIVTIPGIPDSRMGWAVAAAGDLDGATGLELAFSAPQLSTPGKARRGAVEVWTSEPPGPAPNPEMRDPLALEVLDTLNVDTFARVQLENVRPGTTLYFYAGTENTPSTSAEGFLLEISGSSPLSAFEVVNSSVGGQVTVEFYVSPSLPHGQRLYFQAVEELGLAYRRSSLDDKVVIQPFTLVSNGVWEVGNKVSMDALYGNPNRLTYFYYSLAGEGPSVAPDGSWMLGILNAVVWPQSPVGANSVGDATSQELTLPPVAAGLDVWLQAFSWSQNAAAQKLSNVLMESIP